MSFLIRTIKLKVQPDDYEWLNAAAIEVNQVWNYCNATSAKQADYWRQGSPRKPLSGFDLCKLTAGYAEFCEHITADTIQRIAFEHPEKLRIAKDAAFERLKNAKTQEQRASARNTVKRLTAGKLRWRASYGGKRALGWIPFKGVTLKRKAPNSFQYAGKLFRVFNEDYLPAEAKWRDGCFTQDAVGDWHLCLPVREPVSAEPAKYEEAGFDLGLKTLATASDGWKIEPPRFYRETEEKLAKLQRPRGTDKRSQENAPFQEADAAAPQGGAAAQRLHAQGERQGGEALSEYCNRRCERGIPGQRHESEKRS